MDSGFVFSFLNARVAAEYWPRIAEGFALTLALAALIVVAGLLAGLVLAAVRALGIRPLNWLIVFSVDLFRALPPLVILVLLYFGLPSAGMSLSGFWATWLALTLVLAAFAGVTLACALLFPDRPEELRPELWAHGGARPMPAE